MMQLALVYDSCSFTVAKTGRCILLLVSQLNQQGFMVQMDARFQLATFKTFSAATNSQASKVLGVKLSTDDELVELDVAEVDLTVITTGEIYTYVDLQNSLEDIRYAEPQLLT